MASMDILAGGGVVLRRNGDEVKVVVIHRPSYDDWSLPKGKLDHGETQLDGALREVFEETGLACREGVELSPVEYVDGKGRTKHVRYWLMEPMTGSTTRTHVDNEIDEVRWVNVREAGGLLTYIHDQELLTEALHHFEARS